MALFDNSRFPWPQSGDINMWADFAERICLFSDGKQLSMEDFKNWLLADKTIEIEDIEKALKFDDNFMKPFIAHTPRQEKEKEFLEDIENEELDTINSSLLPLFKFLKLRGSVFAENYPFEISKNFISLKNPLNDMRKVYIVLLFSSDLRIYQPEYINRIGHQFEKLCEGPFNQLVSKKSTIKFFGAGAGELGHHDYTGNLQKRIKDLASDLGLNTTTVIEDPDELSPTGDAGLDWVAWAEFPDKLNHQPLFFAQCACGSNWVDKQHETSLGRWHNFFEINQPVHHIHFLPRSFRRIKGEWLKETSIEDVILIDRSRLLYLINNEGSQQPILTLYQTLLEEWESFQLR